MSERVAGFKESNTTSILLQKYCNGQRGYFEDSLFFFRWHIRAIVCENYEDNNHSNDGDDDDDDDETIRLREVHLFQIISYIIS